jgi:hypothetical protein
MKKTSPFASGHQFKEVRIMDDRRRWEEERGERFGEAPQSGDRGYGQTGDRGQSGDWRDERRWSSGSERGQGSYGRGSLGRPSYEQGTERGYREDRRESEYGQGSGRSGYGQEGGSGQGGYGYGQSYGQGSSSEGSGRFGQGGSYGRGGSWRPGDEPTYGNVGRSSGRGYGQSNWGGSEERGLRGGGNRGGGEEFRGGSSFGRPGDSREFQGSFGRERSGSGEGSRFDEEERGQRSYAGGYGLGYSGQRGRSMGGSMGRFSGKGPKGYTRSDERIKEQVSEKLEESGDIDASEITVEVRGGEVTLEGTVPDRWMKRMAEDVAEECSGVKQVQNRLRVEKAEGGSSGSSSSERATSSGTSSSGASSSTSGSSTESDKGTRPRSSL